MMWDLNTYNDQHRSNNSRRTPSPAHTTFTPAGYPSNTSYIPMPQPNLSAPATTPQLPPPQYYSHLQSPVPAVIPRSQYPGRHRSHSHSKSSGPVADPQPVTYSNSYFSSHHTIPTAVDYPQIRDFPRPLHYSHGSMEHVQPAIPQRVHALTSSSSVIPAPHSHGPFLCSNCTGRKKALCIGINYRGQSNELRGCVNDARNVRKWLMKYHGFKSEDVILLTDDTIERRHLPTRQNLISAMKWLVRSARPNDSLFFHYSGHGGQVEDEDGDEIDGFDEVIFPLDYKEAGFIVDDELHEIMVSRLPAGCRLTGLFDSCHSGTVLDLPHIYSCHGSTRGDITEGPRQNKSSRADVISWSACKDGETSADTFHDGVAVGAMSNAFISSLQARPNQSYEQLLHSVREILGSKYGQTPQLGSSHPIDMRQKFIV